MIGLTVTILISKSVCRTKFVECVQRGSVSGSMWLLQEEQGLVERLQIPPKILLSYLIQVEDHYRPAVPYHNSTHAADVAQTMHYLLSLQALQVHNFCSDLCRHAVSAMCDSLSVRPSVTFVYSVETNKRIFKIFLQSGSHTILVFHTKGSSNIRKGTSLTRVSNATGVGKNRDTRPISGPWQVDGTHRW